MTVTDLGWTVAERPAFCTFTAKALGTTAFGESNVLMLSTAGAVNVSAVAAFALIPLIRVSIVTGFSGSRFVTATSSLPSAVDGPA
jgi:hypothetical protein